MMFFRGLGKVLPGVIRGHRYVTDAAEAASPCSGEAARLWGDESQKIDALFIDLDADAWRSLRCFSVVSVSKVEDGRRKLYCVQGS